MDLYDEDSPVRLVRHALPKRQPRSTKPTDDVDVLQNRKKTKDKVKRASPKKYVEKLVRASAGPRAPPQSVSSGRSSVRLGSDCAGYGSDFLALTFCGVNVETVFCAEIDSQKIALLRQAHDLFNDTQFTIFKDVKDRDNAGAPECDIFITGAPCQAYSTAGRGAGLADGKDRGVTVFYSLDYVRIKQPKVVIVENARGLTFKQHRHVLDDILRIMEQLGYVTKWRVLNTKEHGIPQSRPRLYIVGVRKDSCVHKFRWPKPVPATPGRIIRFLDADSKCEKSSINRLNNTVLDTVVFWRRTKKQSDGVDILKRGPDNAT